MTNLPINQVLQKPYIARRMVRWVVMLSEYDIEYEPQGPIKVKVYVDFVVVLALKNFEANRKDFVWILSTDGSSNLQGSGTCIILEGPDVVLLEKSLKFTFKASNNQVEYEALIVRMLLAKELGVCRLLAKNNSLLITGQVSGDYQAKDP